MILKYSKQTFFFHKKNVEFHITRISSSPQKKCGIQKLSTKKMWKKKEAFWPKYFGGRLKFVGNLRQLYSGIAFLTRENNSLYVNFIFFSPAAATFHIKIKYCVIAKHNCKNSAKYLGKIWFFDLGTFFFHKKNVEFFHTKNVESRNRKNVESGNRKKKSVFKWQRPNAKC